MTKVLHGIVHGKFIEVTEDLGLLDGQAVELIVTASPASGPSLRDSIRKKNPKGRRARRRNGGRGGRRPPPA